MASRDVIEQVALRAKQSAASGSRKGASQQVIDAVRERAQKAAGTVTDSGFVDPRPFVGVSTETDGSRYAVPAGSTTKSSTGGTTGFTAPPKKSTVAGVELSPERQLEQLGQSLSKKWKNQMQLGTLDDASALRRSDPLTEIKAQRQARMDALKQELRQFGPDDLITKADEIRQKEKELLALEKEDKKSDFEQLGAYLNEQQLARAKQRQQQELNDGKSHPLGHLVTSYIGGVSDWVQGVVDAIDGIMPGEQELPALQPFRYGKQAIKNMIENYGDTVDPTARKYGEMIARGIGYSTPSAVAAMLPGVQGLSAAAGGGVTGLLKNPSFWMSAVPTYGSSYADAKNDGADELQAQAMAILNGFAGAAVEVGGGIEQIPNSEPGIKTWIKGMLDEGKEEVLQGVIEQLAKKIVYDHDRAFYSLTDEDALINPNRAAQEFLGGALVGGVLGGAQTATQAIARYSGYSQIGQNVMQSEGGVETALSIGLANAKTTEEYQAALRMDKDIKKGKAPSAYAVGKLVADSQSEQAVRSRQINSLLMKSAEEYKASAETADAVAAVATRFGRPIVFADPEKLNGAAGLYDADSNVIAVSPKLTTREAVDFVLKHELTHAIEGSETYADLAALVRQQMGEEGFAAAVEKMAEQRRAAGDESGAQSAEKEVIADWIGNNLFRKGFADKVTAKNRTLGEQFYRALWNVRRALGFTDSATQSERIRAAEHAFADQLQSDYRRGGRAEANADAIAGLENVQYSIKTAPDGQKYVDIDVDQSLFDGLTDIEKLKMAEMVIRERFVGKVIDEEETAYVTKYTAKEYGHPAKHLRDSALVDAKARASTELDNLLAAATGWKNEPDGQYGHAHKKAAGGFDRGTVLFKVGDELYQGMINIEVTERGRVLKDITQISVADEKQRAALSDYRSIKQGSTPVSQSNSNTSVSQETSDVNTQYMQNGTENAQTTASGRNVQYSILKDDNGLVYVDADDTVISDADSHDIPRILSDIISKKFNNLIVANGQEFGVNRTTNNEWRWSKDAQKLRVRDAQAYQAKLEILNNADEVLQAAHSWIGEGPKHQSSRGFVEFGRGRVAFRVDGQGYSADVIVGIKKDGSAQLYDLVRIDRVKIKGASNTDNIGKTNAIYRHDAPIDTSVSQDNADVNTKYMQNGTKNAQRSYLPDELSAREQETDSSKARIKEQLRAHQDELNAQAPVSEKEVDYTFKGFQKSVEWAAGFFADGNDRVYRPDMGEIVVDKKRIRKALRYVKSESEVMAFAALEDVIRKGTAIDGHSDHKGRGYETVTIAAPVVINGIRFNMAAVIRKDGNNYYKVHRILMPDGSIVDLKKAEVTSRTAGGAKNDTHLSPNDVTSEVTPNRAGGIDDDTHLSPNGDASVDSIARSAEKSQGESFQRAYLPDDISAQERAAQAENIKRLANRTDAQTETDTETDVDTDTEAEYDEAAMDEMIDKAAERRRTKLEQAQREETARLTEQLKNGEIDADTFGREMERLRSEAVADNEKKWRRGERGPMEQREQIRRERRTARADYVEKKAQLEADTAAQKAADTQKRRADSERKKKAEYRRQASKIVDELDSLLSHPSKDRHVPLEALNTVREVLETVSEDPQGIRQEMDEIRRQMAETADQRKITRLERQLDARKKRLAKVSDMLGRVQELGKTTEGDGFALAQDGFFAKKIAALRESMDGKTVDALTANETKEVVDVLRAIVKQMRDINTFHSNAMREGVTDTAVRFIREMDAASAYGRLGETIRNMMTWQLTPDRFFEAVCGWKTDSVGKQIADSMTEAEKKELSIRREFGDLFDDAVNGKGRKSYDALGDTKHLVDIGLRDAKGQPMQMTRGMMLSLYMQLNCPANRQALIDSGFIVPELKRYYKGDVENAYANGQRLTPTALSGEIHDVLVKMANAQTDIERQNLDAELTALTVRANQDLDAVAETIAGLMTDDERQFVKLAQQWFNDISKKHINEATREVWGYEAARVKDYFPLYRSKFFVTTGMDSLVQDMTVGNTGSLKSRVHSKAPINLADISQVLTASVDTTAKFSAWLGFTTDFQKLYNAVTPGGKSSVKETLARKWGKGKAALGVTGDSYVQNLMADISGNRRADASPLSFFRKNAVRATLTLNLRVAVSQAASLPTAAAEIGWKYTGKALKHLPKVNAETMALIRKFSPYFWERSRGAGGTEEIALAKSGQNAIDTLWSKLNKATHGHLLNWCQEVDVRTVALCWFGCEERIQAERPDLKVGSDAYYQAVGEMLDTVIRKTQPNFTVTERSDLLRSKNEAMKFLTMYKTQANQQMNILYEATGRYRAAQQAFKNGTGTKAELDAAKQQLVNGYTGVIGGTITLVLLRTLVNVLIHKVNGYRDEDGEVTASSMAGAIGQEMLSSIAGSYAFGDVVYEAVAARVFGSSYYGVSDTALETAGNLLKDFATGDLSSGKTWQYVTRDLMNVLGIPYKNVADMAAGLGYHIEDIRSGEFLSMNAGYTTSDGMFYRRLYRYTQKGDTEKAQHLRQYLLMTGKTEEQIDAGMRTAIKGEDRDYKKEQERLFREVCRSGLYGKLTDKEKKRVESGLSGYVADKVMAEKTGGTMTAQHIKVEAYAGRGVSPADYYLAQTVKNAAFADADGDGKVSREEYRRVLTDEQYDGMIRQLLFGLK